MKNIRTKRNTFNSISKQKEMEIPVFPVEVRYVEPTATPMPKQKGRVLKPKNKQGKKSKSGFHWSEKQNRWIEVL